MSSEKEPIMQLQRSRALAVKPPPRGIDLPCSDGEPMETPRHRDQMILLISTLSDAWKDRNDVYISGNEFVYYSELQAKNNSFRGPDFFVVLNTEKKERRSWVVWEENGRRPDLVIELISESTEKEDRGPKKDIYAKLLGVSEYYLYDPWTHSLEGYRLCLTTQAYEPMVKDEQGRYWSEIVGFGLGVVNSEYGNLRIDWLRWLDAEGRPLPHKGEVAEAARQEAAAEKQLAEVARQEAAAEKQLAEVARRGHSYAIGRELPSSISGSPPRCASASRRNPPHQSICLEFVQRGAIRKLSNRLLDN